MMRLLLLVVLLGCGLGATGDCGGAGLPAALELPVTTAIPPGIYSGDMTTRFEQSVNGIAVLDETSTKPFSDVVDENGLPTIQPGGETPVVGLVLNRQTADYSSTLTILSSEVSGNRWVCGFTDTRQYPSGTSFSGNCQWTYEYIAPDTLEYQDFRSFAGTLADGTPTTYRMTGSATLTK